MSFRLGPYVPVEDGWENIGHDWWRTSFRDVPWSYVPRLPQKPKRKSFCGTLFCNPPTSTTSDDCTICDEAESINAELVGAKTALDALAAYERDVGFHLADLGVVELRTVDLSIPVDEKDVVDVVAATKKKWDDLLDDLMNGPAFEDADSASLSSSGELHRSTSTFSSLSSIDSIGPPSTPRPKSSFADVEIKDGSPPGSIHYPVSPTRSLNAAASSFVPTFCPQLIDEPISFPTLEDRPKPAESFSGFTFPTLNSHSPIKPKKDDQSDAASPEVGNGLLPPFMQETSVRNRTRKSRTREIVDRLRSRMAPVDEPAQPQPTYGSLSPSPAAEEAIVAPRLCVSEDGGDRVSRLSSPSMEDDGWIDVAQPVVPSTSQSHKSKRARELLFVLKRRRTDSVTSENIKDLTADLPTQNVSAPSPSPSPPVASTADGWIESSPRPPAEQPKKPKPSSQPSQAQHPTHSRKKSSNHGPRGGSGSAAAAHAHQQHLAYNAGYAPHTNGAALPHMIPAQMIPGHPYFFPAYPAAGMPLAYGAFMQVPAYQFAMSMQGGAPGMQYAIPPPSLPPTTASMKPAAAPAFRAKHAPLW